MRRTTLAWLRRALGRLEAELSEQARPVALSVVVEDDGEMVCYSAGYGVRELGRRVITDMDEIADAAERGTVDVAPWELT